LRVYDENKIIRNLGVTKMSKRKTELTEKKIAQMEKEGRGQGTGENYKPWITIQDFPSKGLSTRTNGWKTNRIHQFLSKMESDYFYSLEWDQSIVDVQEQFPLTREDTLHIATSKGIKHPTDPKSQIPIVMTTDFLITISTSTGTTHVARTIKPSKDLENGRTIEKFEIERCYWEDRGIDWGIVTEKELPRSLIENVEWLHSSYFGIRDMPTSTVDSFLLEMKSYINRSNSSIMEVVSEFDQLFNLEPGTGLDLLKHLIARKVLHVNIHQKIHTHLWIEDVFEIDTK